MSLAKMRRITNKLKQEVAESGRIKAQDLTWKSEPFMPKKQAGEKKKAVKVSTPSAAASDECHHGSKENQQQKHGQLSLRDLCPEDKLRVKGLVEEVARLGSEKEKLEKEMSRERTALQGLLENLQAQHHKVVEEKKELEIELTSSQLKFHYLQSEHPELSNHFTSAGRRPSGDIRLSPSKHNVSRENFVTQHNTSHTAPVDRYFLGENDGLPFCAEARRSAIPQNPSSLPVTEHSSSSRMLPDFTLPQQAGDIRLSPSKHCVSRENFVTQHSTSSHTAPVDCYFLDPGEKDGLPLCAEAHRSTIPQSHSSLPVMEHSSSSRMPPDFTLPRDPLQVSQLSRDPSLNFHNPTLCSATLQGHQIPTFSPYPVMNGPVPSAVRPSMHPVSHVHSSCVDGKEYNPYPSHFPAVNPPFGQTANVSDQSGLHKMPQPGLYPAYESMPAKANPGLHPSFRETSEQKLVGSPGRQFQSSPPVGQPYMVHSYPPGSSHSMLHPYNEPAVSMDSTRHGGGQASEESIATENATASHSISQAKHVHVAPSNEHFGLNRNHEHQDFENNPSVSRSYRFTGRDAALMENCGSDGKSPDKLNSDASRKTTHMSVGCQHEEDKAESAASHEVSSHKSAVSDVHHAEVSSSRESSKLATKPPHRSSPQFKSRYSRDRHKNKFNETAKNVSSSCSSLHQREAKPPSPQRPSSSHKYSLRRVASKTECTSASTQTLNLESVGVQTEATPPESSSMATVTHQRSKEMTKEKTPPSLSPPHVSIASSQSTESEETLSVTSHSSAERISTAAAVRYSSKPVVVEKRRSKNEPPLTTPSISHSNTKPGSVKKPTVRIIAGRANSTSVPLSESSHHNFSAPPNTTHATRLNEQDFHTRGNIMQNSRQKLSSTGPLKHASSWRNLAVTHKPELHMSQQHGPDSELSDCDEALMVSAVLNDAENLIKTSNFAYRLSAEDHDPPKEVFYPLDQVNDNLSPDDNFEQKVTGRERVRPASEERGILTTRWSKQRHQNHAHSSYHQRGSQKRLQPQRKSNLASKLNAVPHSDSHDLIESLFFVD